MRCQDFFQDMDMQALQVFIQYLENLDVLAGADWAGKDHLSLKARG